MTTFKTLDLKKTKFYERLILAFKTGNLFLFPHLTIRKGKIVNNLTGESLYYSPQYIIDINFVEDYKDIKNFIIFALKGTTISIKFLS
jgi:hypothetical protein